MTPFEYANPNTLKEALALLGSQWGEADVLAGGTDLLSLMKDGLHSPKRVVNIKSIKELGGIARAGANLRIGATVTVDELMSNAIVRAEFPALIEAARGVSSMQIRNMGTVGGDLCQRPRCWYYRQGFGLLAMHQGQNLVEKGENQYHAIFGDGPGRFVSASSFGPALIALGAKVKLVSASGERILDADKFFVNPTSEQMREVALQPSEILTEIHIPLVKTRNATYEVRHKDALDWPLVTASVALSMKGTAVEKASIVLGHVATTPWAASAAAQSLSGKTINATTAEAAAALATNGARPLSGNAYKVQLARTAVKRALLAAAGVKA
jgi:xanthine dehydrogenase YagS FAD-binding subunit